MIKEFCKELTDNRKHNKGHYGYILKKIKKDKRT